MVKDLLARLIKFENNLWDLVIMGNMDEALIFQNIFNETIAFALCYIVIILTVNNWMNNHNIYFDV